MLTCDTLLSEEKDVETLDKADSKVCAVNDILLCRCEFSGPVFFQGVNLMSEQHKAVIQFQKGEQAAKCVAKCNQ